MNATRICSILVALTALLPAVSPANQPTSAAGLRQAAARGNAAAELNLGLAYATGNGVSQDDRQAVAWWRKAAEQGNAAAEYYLGKAYYVGQGIAQDERQGLFWIRKAAQQGNADAETGLGFAFDLGRGVPQDYNQSVSWFRKAAEQGDTAAETGLGLDYAMGRGVPRDSVLAHMLLELAVVGGNQNGIDAYHLLQRELSPAQLGEAQALAAHWKAGTPLPTAP